MKNLGAVLGLVAALLFVGCAKPRIDASSDQKMSESIAKVRESLPEARQSAFDAAVRDLTLEQFDFRDLFAGDKGRSADQRSNDLRAMLGGKTGEEIIASASLIDQRKSEKDARAADSKRRDEEYKQGVLRKFLVVGQFALNQDTAPPQAEVTFMVRNNTGQPVSGFALQCKFVSPGRSVPWFSEPLTYAIPGGIESGETKTMTLVPGRQSAWIAAEVGNDAKFEVEVVSLKGADGKVFATRPD